MAVTSVRVRRVRLSPVGNAGGREGNHGTLSGATWSGRGRYGRALQFDGVNDWVTVPDSASLDLTIGMTLEAWVYPTATTGWRTVIFKEQSAQLVYALYASTDTSQPSGHVFVVNGSRVASRSVSGAIATSGNRLRIGGNRVSGQWFAGRIDEVRIYNRALSAGEIQADMNTPVTLASGVALVTQSSPTVANVKTNRTATTRQTPSMASANSLRAARTNSSPETSSTSEMASELLTAHHIEAAEVQVDHQWRRLEFKKAFTDPIVVAKALSCQDAEPATVSIRDVDATGFEMRLQSWQNADRVHAPEIVGYLVIERGRYTVTGGRTIEAVTAEISPLSSTISLGFHQPFQATPVVMTAVLSAPDADAATG